MSLCECEVLRKSLRTSSLRTGVGFLLDSAKLRAFVGHYDGQWNNRIENIVNNYKLS